ncbi:helix-turn-helix domain-containing protein [Methylobacterium sp. WL8]|uniref:helix-turn-helix domain-containing protein n=1 Tax=Methylobacterium sp. WL8 TaxID=2603899 RepID=UPI0011C8CCD3|nr:helix-turn-helix domain-containing protein [Methylobacterium sp. WL8]TXN76892.1 helix-turn-helix domain-containing protein [Methylobacterium sp. WL8]
MTDKPDFLFLHGNCELLIAVMAFIDSHLGDRNLNPKLIQDHFEIGRSTLYRILEQSGGVREIILRRRLNKSIELLFVDIMAFGDLKKIAKEAGFSSQHHFSRTFAARYGVPPQKFRVLAREQAKRREAAQRRKVKKAAGAPRNSAVG